MEPTISTFTFDFRAELQFSPRSCLLDQFNIVGNDFLSYFVYLYPALQSN